MRLFPSQEFMWTNNRQAVELAQLSCSKTALEEAPIIRHNRQQVQKQARLKHDSIPRAQCCETCCENRDQAENRRGCRCTVSFLDSTGVRHTVMNDADSLFEAAVLAIGCV